MYGVCYWCEGELEESPTLSDALVGERDCDHCGKSISVSEWERRQAGNDIMMILDEMATILEQQACRS